MAIRMSGLQSGLDTESLVSALVSGYTVQKDNLVKAQTKHQWKQDAWKSMNTSIYSFYSGKLSSARLSKTYNLKTSSISDSTKAKVTASSSAVNGTQTLEVKKLAATGYLTGAQIETTDGGSVSGSTKLSDVTGLTDGRITVTAGGSTKEISVTEDMTVDEFVSKLKDAGLNASFDEANKRMFVSSKTSGADNDFTLTASDANGLTTLQNLGLYTINDSDKEAYASWASLATDDDGLAQVKDAAYESKKINYADRAATYADKYNSAAKIISGIESDATWEENDTIDSFKARLQELESEFDDKYTDYVKKDADGNAVKDESGNVTYDEDALKEAGLLEEYNSSKNKISSMKTIAENYEKAMADIEASRDYVTLTEAEDGTVTASADETNASVVAEVESENATIRANSDSAIDEKVAFSVDMMEKINNGSITSSDGAVRIVGADSEIYLNGARYTNNTNNFSVNGLTVEATALTDSAVTITTNTDVDGIYNNIKSFFSEYNTLIKAMDTAYNADSAKGYEPLTSDEKEAMTDDEVEKWEKKIKDALLRKDSTLNSVSTNMKNLMAQSIEINGKKYSLATFGIKTQGYFDAATNEKGVYHIDGDSEDSVSSGNDDKLREAIASDPDTVIEFFSQLTTGVYNKLGKMMTSSSMNSAYTIYNDKQMAKEYSTYTTKISDMEDKITTWEDYYYNKFSSMESALAKLNSTQSSLSGYFS